MCAYAEPRTHDPKASRTPIPLSYRDHNAKYFYTLGAFKGMYCKYVPLHLSIARIIVLTEQ